jgi:Ca-activated chloride channel family protein
VSFASPLWLAALAALPLGLAAQHLARRRARRYALRFPAFESVRSAAAGASQWRRHVALVALLLAAAALSVALARPRVATTTAIRQASLVLVLDHSGSMQSTDVAPTRLQAAVAAATTFLAQLPSTVRVGFVGFSTTPDAVMAPTTSRAAISAALHAQVANGSTATGNALDAAIGLLQTIGRRRGRAAIVLLSDGAANAGQSPILAARTADHDDIAIDTVALGTPDGTVTLEPSEAPIAVPPDPQLMAQIAMASGGRTFDAQDAGSLDSIYKGLGVTLGSRTSTRDLTGLFVAIGLALAAAATLAAVRFGSRVPA